MALLYRIYCAEKLKVPETDKLRRVLCPECG